MGTPWYRKRTMNAKTIKSDTVGKPPLCHSVEMLVHDDGSFEVVMRTIPDRDPDSATYPPPKLVIEKYTNRAEADFKYATTLGIMKRVGPPA